MKLSAAVFLIIFSLTAYSQAKIRKMPSPINNPSINVSAPFISMDGTALLYTTDYTDDGTAVFFTVRENADWKMPVELPKHINNRLHLPKSYTLSADGKTLYITSIKSGGVGLYDIWFSERKGETWSELRLLYPPINSKSNDASPTLTTDGNTMYFMRCEKMDNQKSDNCKLVVSIKKNGQWQEPVELPASINTGNSQYPRIMADGETLIFSSNKMAPNKGGMDLYVTKLINGLWSNPVPLDIANTERDDQYVSAQATGRYLLKDAPGKIKTEILEYLIPDELRPKAVMKVEGTVKDSQGAPTPSYLLVVDMKTNNRFYSGRPMADGTFYFYITEGSRYELSIDHENGAYTFYSKTFDLTTNAAIRNEKLQVELKPLEPGDVIELEGLQFKPYSYELENPESELKRVSRLIKNNAHLSFELQITLSGYREDSIQSSSDLTELITDTTNVSIEAIDSVGQLITRDSLVVQKIYHNNRTDKQANTIVQRLVESGVDKKRVSVLINTKPDEVTVESKTSVKLLAKAQ